MKKMLMMLTALCFVGMTQALTVHWTTDKISGAKNFAPESPKHTDDYRMVVLLVKGSATEARQIMIDNRICTTEYGCLTGVKDLNGKDVSDEDARKVYLSRGWQNGEELVRAGSNVEGIVSKDGATLKTKGKVEMRNNPGTDYKGDISLIFARYYADDLKNSNSSSHYVDTDNMMIYELGYDQWSKDELNLHLDEIKLGSGIQVLPEPTVPALLALGVAGVALKRKIA